MAVVCWYEHHSKASNEKVWGFALAVRLLFSEVSHLHKYPVLAPITIISRVLTWLVFPPGEALTIHCVPYSIEFKQ